MRKVPFMEETIEDVIQIFGAGAVGKRLVKFFQQNGVSINSIIDNNPRVVGNMVWDEIPCISPSEANIDIPVALCFRSDKMKKEVYDQCKDMGFKKIYEVDLEKVLEYAWGMPDEQYLEIMFYSTQGKRLDIHNPKTLNEKLQWLKLHDKNPLYILLGDKLRARSYLRNLFGDEYLVPLLNVTFDPDAFDERMVPAEPCVIKTNCWSGDIEIVRTKDNIDWGVLKERYSKVFNSDWARHGREWWYSYMEPCIMVEKLLETKDGRIPNDYKLHFINGELQFIYCSIDREGANYRKIYSPEWKEMPFSWNGKGSPPEFDKPNIAPPETLGEMIKMGSVIAQDIPYVRVDYYDVDGKLYFGEITLSHGAGFDRFVPYEYDLIYGEKLVLPQKNGENINNYLEKFKAYSVPAHDVWHMDNDNKEDVLKLDWNEASIQVSSKVQERIVQMATRTSNYYYYPNTNNEGLIKRIADYVCVNFENIQVFPSSDVAHEYIAKVWIRKGDECGILSPTYDNFRATMELADATVSYCYMNDMQYSKVGVQKYFEQHTPKMFYLCNPNNPTGEQISINEVEYLLNKYPKTLFVVDEAYGEFSGITAAKLIKKNANIVITRTFSKAFGLANFRIGYVISSVDNIRLLNKVRNCKNVSTFAQEAAIAALDDKESMFAYVEEVNNAKEWFVSQLNKLPFITRVYGSSANFIMFEVKNWIIKINLINYLRKNGIFVRDIGQSYYIKEHCVRITIGTMDQMKRVSQVMRDFDYENCNI